MIPIRIYVIIFQNVTGNENSTDSRRKFPNSTFRQVICAIQRPHLQSNTSTSGTEAEPGRKIIPCNPRTGHRIKDGSVPAAMCVHSRLKALHQLPEDWTLSQCLFGEHMLPLCPELPVALVEVKKTAVICSAVFPKFLWLATGGLGQFNDRVKVLLGRQVIAFPDLGAYDRWRKKAKDYPLLDITVSDYLEKNATPQQREMGADLADLVVEERMVEGEADRR